MNKSELRKAYLQRRRELDPEKISEMSAAITVNFSTLSFTAVNYLHIFYPIAGKSEFNSLLLAGLIREKHPEIKLVLSKSDIQTHTLSHYIWNQETPLAMNQWGITEPEDGITIDPKQLDMVLVPLLAFDKSGNRVGYGKGFYDRFLSECRQDVQKIGISYFPPEEQIQDVTTYDIPLNLCITPDKIWGFKN